MTFILAKIFTGLVFLLASLLALSHFGAGGDVAKGRFLRLLRLTRLFGHGDEHRNLDDQHELSKCEKCLAEGMDFCISGNECIPRATFQCRGPYDHITGDKEFSLHGNPDGIQHSMSCPAPHAASKSGDVDVRDCYFDKECHAKVDWAKITRIKAGFFARLKHFKEMRDPHGVEKMMGKVHHMFHEAGMPEDRIDYILLKWVKSVFPESLTGAPTEDEPRMPMCVVAKERCTKDGKPVLQGRCGVQWKACEHEKSAHHNKKFAVDDKHDKKDCYFDKECHSKVDWETIWKIKRGFFMRLKNYKKTENKEAAKKAMKITHGLFQKAGVPDDRIEYILIKWVKSVYPEVLQSSAAMLTV